MRRPLSLALVAVACLTGPLHAQKAQLDAFEDAFEERSSPGPAFEERDRALNELLGDSERVTEALLEALVNLENEAEKIETQRRRSLFETSDPDITLQRREVLDGLRELQQRVVWRLNDTSTVGSIELLVVEALDEGDLPFSARIALAEKARDLDASSASKVSSRVKRRDAADAATALLALVALNEHSPSSDAAVIKQLASKSEMVRELAARAIARHPTAAGVEALIKRLPKEDEGRTRTRLAAALEIVTRAKLGLRDTPWQNWWSEHEADVESGAFELSSGTSAQLVSGVREREESADDDERYYHALALDGQGVLFVLDRSESMIAPMRDASDAAGETVTRIDFAKKELKAALGALRPTARFNIVVFSTGTFAFADGMASTSAANLEIARKWIDEIDLIGGTSLYDGLDYGFTLAGRPTRDLAYDGTIDTVYLLTDGLPTRPYRDGLNRMFEQDSYPAILGAVDRWNPLDRAVVHVIVLGSDFPAGQLRALAEDNGGRLVQEF